VTPFETERLSEATGLPTPGGVALATLGAEESDEAGLAEFAEIVGCDAGLSAGVLRFANSPTLGAGLPIPTVREAMTRLSPRAVRVVVVSQLLVAAEGSSHEAGRALAPVWTRSMARAIVAKRLAQRLDLRRAGDAAQAAALMDLALLALWAIDRSAAAGVASSYGDARARAGSALMAFGMPVAAASAEILRWWRAPKRLWGPIRAAAVEPSDRTGDGADVAMVLRAADQAAERMLARPEGAAAIDVQAAGVPTEVMRQVIAESSAEWGRRRGMLESPAEAEQMVSMVRAKANQTLASLSLATQLENRVMLRRQQELMRRVTTDSLTQVKNRLAFDERLVEEFERCQRSGKPLTLFLVDLDHFKQFNDVHGHQAGDAMLRTAASALAGAARRVDMVARYGGEEFVVIAPDCGHAGAAALAERLRRAIEEAASDWHGQSLRTTASIGGAVVSAGQQRRTPAEAVAAADRLLYEAKRAGRNRAFVEPPSAGEEAVLAPQTRASAAPGPVPTDH
jgi:diguanylate cyclase (GGDEF)-like protein